MQGLKKYLLKIKQNIHTVQVKINEFKFLVTFYNITCLINNFFLQI